MAMPANWPGLGLVSVCAGLALVTRPVWPSAGGKGAGTPDFLCFRGSMPSPHVPLSMLAKPASRRPSHDSGPAWFAAPSL